ncbi:hypothetical protein [Sporichthya polymorpha]|uniref:hypothetical protein n=1 Tax=Sporichthya polymorpha TaxID=35751 RepID=UPI0003A3CBD8|nr:hypothetical protein [Sporichthya polymorpha]
MRLPARYVAEHVELGYASTVHRAQGATVDTAHLVAGPGMDRQSLYVAMARGREANHAYIPLDVPAEEHLSEPYVTGRQILDHALATDGRDHSATVTMGRRQDAAFSQQRLASIRETLSGAKLPEVAAEVDRLIALRRADRAAPHSATRPSPGKGHDPIGR